MGDIQNLVAIIFVFHSHDLITLKCNLLYCKLEDGGFAPYNRNCFPEMVNVKQKALPFKHSKSFRLANLGVVGNEG